jgi:hypothetical protein
VTEKRKILHAYEKDMTDYKNKKFQLQKELESVYYGLAERTLKTTKTAEEEFLQRQDELKNSVSVFINVSARRYNVAAGNASNSVCTLEDNSFAIPIGAIHFRSFRKAR